MKWVALVFCSVLLGVGQELLEHKPLSAEWFGIYFVVLGTVFFVLFLRED